MEKCELYSQERNKFITIYKLETTTMYLSYIEHYWHCGLYRIIAHCYYGNSIPVVFHGPQLSVVPYKDTVCYRKLRN